MVAGIRRPFLWVEECSRGSASWLIDKKGDGDERESKNRRGISDKYGDDKRKTKDDNYLLRVHRRRNNQEYYHECE